MAGTADPRAVQSILRAVALVEERLGQPIGVEAMARAAAYSLFHFSRLFTAGTGHAPYDYLMRRRVAVAAEQVVGGSRSLTEIALDCGFEAPDGFARAFRRCFGDAPSEARRRGSYPCAIARLPVGRDMVEFLLAQGLPMPERVDAEERILAGFYAESHDLGRSFMEPLGRRLDASRFLVVRDHANDGPDCIFVGVETHRGGPPVFPLALTTLPGGLRVRFSLPNGGGILRFVREFAFRSWLPTRGVSKVPGFEIVECDPDGPQALSIPVDLASGSSLLPSISRTKT